MTAIEVFGCSSRTMRRIGLALITSLTLTAACSSPTNPAPVGGGTGGQTNQGTGGVASGSGGSTSGTGGSATGSGGSATGTGGAATGTGGAATGTGGLGGGTTAGSGGTLGTGGVGTTGTGGAIGAVGTGGAPAACAAPIPVTGGTAATVTLNLASTPLSRVSPDMMGIHTAVYDGLLTTSTTTETLLKAAGITSLRYPGGSYADQYHWESNTATATPAAGAGSNVIYVDPTANFGSFVLLLQRLGANPLVTVNYGMNSAGTGPGQPKEAAAWVAYANGSPSDTRVIGLDSSTPPVDWMTVGYWAGLRAAAPLLVNDGKNFLRINHPAPVGIRYWELGNEMYGNGYFNGSATSAGWEPDMHAPYNGTNGTARLRNANLAPAMYGAGIVAFAAAMKAVDPTIQFGGVVNWPDNAYAGFNSGALGAGCAAMDFAAVHWYPGSTIASLLTIPHTDIPAMFSGLHALMTTSCGARGGTMPIAVTEWGPNTLYGTAAIIGTTWHPVAPGIPSQTQVGGIFAADSYATFMEQGALAVHWAQLHDNQYLLATPVQDTPGFAYHGQLIAHYLAAGGDSMLPTVSSATTLLSHAAVSVDGGVRVMLTNTGTTGSVNVTVNVSGGVLSCSGFRYGYTPNNTPPNANVDGTVTTDSIFSATTRTSVNVAVPAQSVVVVAFPKG